MGPSGSIGLNSATSAPVVGSPQQTAQPSSAIPNNAPWYDRILPTVGSIAGGVGGSLLGGAVDVASLGALAPIINPITLGIAGASGGDTLGRIGENVATGQNWKDDLGSSAIQGAVGQATGDVLGKVGTTLAGKVLAPLANRFATKLVAGQAPGVTKDLAQYVTNDLGMTNLEKAGQVADVMTGGTEKAANIDGQAELTKVVENGLTNSPLKSVDLSDFQPVNAAAKNAATAQASATNNVVEQAIRSNNLAGTPSGNAIRTNVGGIVNSFENPGSVKSLDALGAQRDVASLASKEYNAYSTTRDPIALDRYNALQQINQALKSKLQLDQIPLAPSDQEALATNLEKYIAPIDKGAAKNIGTQIRSLTAEDGSAPTLADVRNVESNFAQIKSALQQGENAANNNFGTSTADLARQTLPIAGSIAGVGGPKSMIGTVGGLMTANPGADKVGAGGLAGLADLTSKGTPESGISLIQRLTGNKVNANAGLINKMVPVLSKIGAVTAANTPNDIANPSTNSAVPSAQGGNGVNPSTGQPTSVDALMQLYNQLLAQEQANPNNASTGSIVSALNTLAPQVNKQQLAVPVIDNLLNAYGNAGGAQGMGGGLLGRLSGLIPGTAANTFNNQSGAAAAQLASILNISPAQAANMIPQLMQTGATAAPQVGGLNSVLGNFGASPTSAVPALQ